MIYRIVISVPDNGTESVDLVCEVLTELRRRLIDNQMLLNHSLLYGVGCAKLFTDKEYDAIEEDVVILEGAEQMKRRTYTETVCESCGAVGKVDWPFGAVPENEVRNVIPPDWVQIKHRGPFGEQRLTDLCKECADRLLGGEDWYDAV